MERRCQGRGGNGRSLDPQLEFSGWDRPADLVPLQEVAAHVGKGASSHAVLDALRDDGHSKVVPQVDGGAHDYAALGVVHHAHHEGTVDLQFSDRQGLEVRHGRVTRTEVVDAQRHAHGIEGLEDGEAEVAIGHYCRLGQLEVQQVWCDAMDVQKFLYVSRKSGVEQGARGDVHRDRDRAA
jgi:hypothetical protein